MYLLAVQRAAFLQQLEEMPGNGFAFAIRVGGQIQGFGLFQGLGDGLDVPVVLTSSVKGEGRSALWSIVEEIGLETG